MLEKLGSDDSSVGLRVWIRLETGLEVGACRHRDLHSRTRVLKPPSLSPRRGVTRNQWVAGFVVA